MESGVKYIKHSFLPLKSFRTLQDANRQLLEWIMGPAGNRIHGTVKDKPLSRFAEIEKTFLKTLPPIAPEIGSWSKLKLHSNCHIHFEKCYYSAPFRLVQKYLWVRATEKTVQIYHDHTLVAIHPRLNIPGKRATVNDHLPPEAQAYLTQDHLWCREQAIRIGCSCGTLIEELFADRVLDNLRAAQGIIKLEKSFGTLRLEAACKRALDYQNPRYITVKMILTKGLDQQESLSSSPLELNDIYLGQARFTRHMNELLN